MKITNAVLKTLKGDALQQSSRPPGMPPAEDDPVMLISDVLSNAALAPAEQGRPYEPSKTAARYQLAVSLFGKKEGDELDVPADIAVELDRDIARFYPVIVAGQLHLLLK